MYNNKNMTIKEPDVFTFHKSGTFTIMQLTDIHFGFGCFSKKADDMAKNAISSLVKRIQPDLIVVTGDMIFPFFPRSGTSNNGKELRHFMRFMDSFKIPYATVLGNHDSEVGAKYNREALGDILNEGEYSIFSKGKADIFGVGNYFVNIADENSSNIRLSLAMLDSNMYAGKSFFSGFDCIHEDQIDWCLNKLNEFKINNPDLKAMAFFHMPLAEYKEAYRLRKLGDESVKYNFGNVGETNEYFGISFKENHFFEKAKANGIIKAMFCGHDHLNNISLTYQGIQLTYGMSIDYLGYVGIKKKYTHRGATTITLNPDNSYKIAPAPLEDVVSRRVRGKSKDFQ